MYQRGQSTPCREGAFGGPILHDQDNDSLVQVRGRCLLGDMSENRGDHSRGGSHALGGMKGRSDHSADSILHGEGAGHDGEALHTHVPPTQHEALHDVFPRGGSAL